MIWDIAVIGGGASGLTAALTAAQAAHKAGKSISIIILEHMNRIGKKLLATGNGRCNLTNADICPYHYHGDVKAASPLLTQYPKKFVSKSFKQLGLLCRELSEGRVYPYNLQASAVLDILRVNLEKYSIKMECDFSVTQVEKRHNTFILIDKSKKIEAHRIIIATGGMASPQLGSDGSGYQLLKALGHSVTPLLPSLVQLTTLSKRVKPLKGARSLADVRLLCDHKTEQNTNGEVQFTEHGLSGICVFDLSRRAGELLSQNKNVQVALNFAPEYSEEYLFEHLKSTIKSIPDLPTNDLLCGTLNKLVGREIMRYTLPSAPPKASQLHAEDLTAICRSMKDFRFPITGLMPWSSAQITAGGIPLCEITVERMESKCCSGLFLAGEVLNIDGDCGGYNLHWAWISGYTAGKSAFESL